MAIKQQLSAVGLYLALIMILYGQKEVLNKETYEANKDILEADKRDKKENFGPRADQTTYTFEPSKKKGTA
jgi:hypothetical protein